MKYFLNKTIFYTLILFISLIGISTQTYAVTTTMSYAGTANDLGGGSYIWNNPSNATGNTTNTSANSIVINRRTNSNFLSLTNFNIAGAGLPSGASINGIQVDVEWMVNGNRMNDIVVQLTKNGTSGIGNNYANDSSGPTSKTITTYGSITDLWGTTWTTSDLLSSNFGIILQYSNERNQSRQVDVYRVGITIDYTILTETLPGNVLDFETAGGYTVTDGTWTRTTTNPYEGSYSLESGNKTDNSISCFEVTKDIIEDSTISFYKNVSSEANYDFLRFYINGTEQENWSGEVAWSKNFYNISPGFNTFRWCYEKDYSVSSGSDTAWVDYIEIKGLTTPGGVGGMTLWLKADAGTSTTTDGSSLTTWNDQSGNGLNAGGGVSPTYYSTTTNLNYNPLVDFNGTTQYLENLNNGAYSHSYFAVIVPDNQTNGTIDGQVPFGFDCNSGILNTGTCGLPFSGLTLGAFTIAINDEVVTHAIGASTGRRSSQIGTASYQASKPMLINMNENSTANGTEILEKGALINNYNANTYQTLSAADYRIGMSSDAANPFPYDGKIAEIINFDSRINDLDRQKIESYLSLKYGITLDSGTKNYIASDGTTNIWSTTTAGTYTHDIFGIGRDDKSELGQIKSESVNDDGVITIEAVSEGTNLSPSFVDIDDLEFFTISNNDGGNTWSATNSPTGYFILDRKWKFQEIGEIGNVSLDVDVGNTNFDIPNLSVGTDYYFIFDSDNDSLLADETPIAMTNTSGDIWNISLNVSNNTIFTFASEASTNNIPTNIGLSNDTLNENTPTGTTIGTLSTTDGDSGDSHTYTFVAGTGDDDNSYFSIAGNILSINVSPDYEIKPYFYIRIQTDDGNGGQYQKAFTININNIGESITSLIDFENTIDGYKYSLTSGIWDRNTTNPNEGSYSYESDNGGVNNTQSCFEISHTFAGTGTINFDYNVSSALNSDYLRFYIDNNEQDAWSGTVPWTTYTNNSIEAGTHIYKWCYIKDNFGSSGTDNAYIDYIAFINGAIDVTPPNISSINYASGTLLPGGNHNIIINYSDLESGIDTTSDTITLNKWDGSIWGSDISSTGFNLASKTITATQATYPTNNLVFGKYRYNFQISDNSANSSSTGAVFYIDEPELIISTGAIDIGGLENGITKFSTGTNITVKTVGAGFDIILNKTSPLLNGTIEIINWNGIEGVGYDKEPYTSTINIINNDEIIATKSGSINTDGNKNTYIYSIKLGGLIGEEQASGNYSSDISIGIDLDY